MDGKRSNKYFGDHGIIFQCGLYRNELQRTCPRPRPRFVVVVIFIF